MSEDSEFIVYEQWVAAPNLIRFVPRFDHDVVAAQKGWWVTPWQADFATVTALGHTPETPRKRS